jgi:hypothetical protein
MGQQFFASPAACVAELAARGGEAGDHGDVHAEVHGQVASRPELVPATGVVAGEGPPVIDHGGDTQEHVGA